MSLGSEMAQVYMDAYEEAFRRYGNKQAAAETATMVCSCFQMTKPQTINPFEAFLKAMIENSGGDDE